jgi:hypothetical protein
MDGGELEDTSTLGRFQWTPDIDPIDDAYEPDAERDASRERTKDVAKERDSLGRVQLVARTSSFRPRTVMVARPAARKLRTQWTSPQGAQT